MQEMPDILNEITRGLRTRHFPRGQIMLYQGDEPHETLIVRNGIMKLCDASDQDREKILHLFRPFAIAPLAFFSGNSDPIRWFYAALTDCEVYALSTDELRSRMRSDGELASYLINWFSLEVHELLVRLGSFEKTTARDKISAALKFLAVRHSVRRRSGWNRVDFPVNQQLMADLTGLTRESAATILKELQDHGIIRRPRQTILDISLPGLEAKA